MRDPRLNQLAAYVLETRKRKNLNQALIRKRGGPSSGWLGELESGAMTTFPKIETLKKLALGLNEPLEDVIKAAGLADSSDMLSIKFRITKFFRDHGFERGMEILQKHPDHPYLRGVSEYILINERFGEYQDDDDYSIRDPFLELSKIIMAVISGRRSVELSDRERKYIYQEAVYPSPSLRLYRYHVLNESERLHWVTDTDSEPQYIRMSSDLAGDSDYIFGVEGDLLKSFGYPNGSMMFVSLDFNFYSSEDREVLGLLDGRYVVGILRKDKLGEYFEFPPETGLPFRVPVDDEDFPLAIINASYIRNNSNDLVFWLF